VANRIKSTLRQDDLAGRYGGDEFVILMPEVGLPACQGIAQRCQSVVSAEPIEIGASEFWIQISIGLVTSQVNSNFQLEDLIQQADRALLQAKKSGRNRIVSLILP
jgi:diguanylate cyclase (GGDEF)-like protein